MSVAFKDHILLIGLGELGNSILSHLLSHPLFDSSQHTVSILFRASILAAKITLVTSLSARNVSIVKGDVVESTEQELVMLFREHKFTTVISASGMTYPPGTQLKLARAVLAADTKRYLPWQYGLDYDAIGYGKAQDLFDEQLNVRAILRSQNGKEAEWCIVSTGIFMTFLFEGAFGVVEGLRNAGNHITVRVLGAWHNAVTYTHPDDIGLVVAEMVLGTGNWEENKNGVVFIAGDTINFSQVAEAVGLAAKGKKGVEKELWSVSNLKESLSQQPDDGMRKYRVVLAEGVGVSWDKGASWNYTKGLNLKTVEQYARELLEAQGNSTDL